MNGNPPTRTIHSTQATRALVRCRRPATGYVWPGKGGGPMDASSPSQALMRVLDRASMVSSPKPRRRGERPRGIVTLHGLRHTAASIMLAAGVPLIVVSRQLGHANPNITTQMYAHLVDQEQQLDYAAAVFETPRP